MQLGVFPKSGFDQSVTTPVLIGVLASWLATEAFGWVFAGLVVPGYLGAVFLLEPIGGLIDVVEALVTYGVARLIGEHLSKTGLVSRSFGRERFLLVVLVSVIVRLVIEGLILPRYVPHATWAFSIGLVVVPLAANACWKTGLLRGVVQNGIPTLIVFVLLKYVLVPYTNLSLAGFELATENVGASFLASPKAYILLLTGAVLAAVANVRYGWDFNGILVPALVGLVVVEPVKLGATFAEAVILLFVTKAVIRLTPLSRANIEGPRRLVLFFSVDYVLRFAFAWVVGRRIPGADVATLMGFGYLLPTLLAVKMSQKSSVALVLFPTAKVGLASFGVGTALGFVALLFDKPPTAEAKSSRALPEPPARGGQAALWVAASSLSEGQEPDRARLPPGREMAAILGERDQAAARARAERYGLEVGATAGGSIWVARERYDSPGDRVGLPAVIARRGFADPPVVVFVPTPRATPELAYVAGWLVEANLADVAVVAGIDERAEHLVDGAARALARSLAHGSPLLSLRRSTGAPAKVTLAAGRTRDLAVWLSAAPARVAAGAVDLEVPAASADNILARDAPPLFDGGPGESPSALALSLDALIPRGIARPHAPEEVLVLRRRALTEALHPTPGGPSALARLDAQIAGYRYVVFRADKPVVGLLPASAPRQLATLARDGQSGRVVEAPHAGVVSTRDVAVRLWSALDADRLVLGSTTVGAMYHGDAIRAAHATAMEHSRSVTMLRTSLEPTSGGALYSAWGQGGAGSGGLAVSALATMGVTATEAPLELADRGIATRTLFAGTSLVGVRLDAAAMEAASYEALRGTSKTLGDLPRLDAAGLATAASELAKAPIRPWALDAARLGELVNAAGYEASIGARRAVVQSVRDKTASAAVVRTRRGAYLVVVADVGAARVVAASPLETTSAPRPNAVKKPAVAQCDEVLFAGGACEVPR